MARSSPEPGDESRTKGLGIGAVTQIGQFKEEQEECSGLTAEICRMASRCVFQGMVMQCYDVVQAVEGGKHA